MFLYAVRVGVCPRVELEGWLRCFAHPSGGVVCRGHAQYRAFAPNVLFLVQALQRWQLRFLVFCIFLSIICPNCACTQLFFVPYSFFVFCCSRFVQMQALQQRVPGPSPSQDQSPKMPLCPWLTPLKPFVGSSVKWDHSTHAYCRIK